MKSKANQSRSAARRLNVDLTKAENTTLEALEDLTGATTSTLIRQAIVLLDQYAKSQGNLFIEDDGEKVKILLPLSIN